MVTGSPDIPVGQKKPIRPNTSKGHHPSPDKQPPAASAGSSTRKLMIEIEMEEEERR